MVKYIGVSLAARDLVEIIEYRHIEADASQSTTNAVESAMLPIYFPAVDEYDLPVTIQLASDHMSKNVPERAVGVCELSFPVKNGNGAPLSLTRQQLESGIKPYVSDRIFPSVESNKLFSTGQDANDENIGTGFDVLSPSNLSISLINKPKNGRFLYGPKLSFTVTDKEINDSGALYSLMYVPRPGFIGKDSAIFVITNQTGEQIAVKYFFDVNPRNIDLPSEPEGGKYRKYCPKGKRVWKISPFRGESDSVMYYVFLEFDPSV